MTCVVGLKDGERVWIGADMASSSGDEITPRGQSKVFRVGEFLIAGCGSIRAAQLLQYDFEPTLPEKLAFTMDTDQYMAAVFASAMRERFRAGGALEVKSGLEEFEGGFLVGYRGALYEITGNFAAIRWDADEAAIGTGAQPALGALYATRGQPARDRVLRALEAAERYVAHIRRPFTVMSTVDGEGNATGKTVGGYGENHQPLQA